ncbi:DUF4097 family beta strand repeat-containing protein [Pseudomarimonas arenosa]|uniref:DUF4097 family beta strand repeat protein n=1 Tax=Pseudomarimonas arenosa TaxID=2774145 RepID=A0AAW3ZNR3_9GAMM|nr:DUF4097 family beta strand repeat-containing protein [Pseudomarimonas arenosa]MBD8526274.1 DUF4097 family beta strand repeat protein [Pseudomarimonas arenosa]
MRIELPFTACLLLASGSAFAWGDCDHRAERALDIAPGQAVTLALAVGAGDLEVRGDPKASQIQLRGRACASSQALLDQIQFLGQTSGDRVEAQTQIPKLEGGWGSDTAYIDVTVVMPAHLILDLRDSSGDIDIHAVAAVKVKDSSGDIRIREIGGSVEVADSSGDIEIRTVAGNVEVTNDSSGDIEIDDVQGNALVRVDSSGDIELSGIRKNAEVGRDSSGGIVFKDIGGNATVGSDSSGGIRASKVRGDFIVDADTNGDISHSDIGGRVDVPMRR